MDIKERLMSHVQVNENGCWIWTGSKNSEGYGNIGIGSRKDGTRRTAKAHRVSYSVFVGDIPENHDICHKCDNPSCINPDHLFTGTEKDNIADMDAKGRRGFVLSQLHPSAKLTEKDVIEARKLREQGHSYYSLAKKYGVYRETMRSAIIGKNMETHGHRPPRAGGGAEVNEKVRRRRTQTAKSESMTQKSPISTRLFLPLTMP